MKSIVLSHVIDGEQVGSTYIQTQSLHIDFADKLLRQAILW